MFKHSFDLQSQCWASIADYDPVLNQRWINVASLLAVQSIRIHHYRQDPESSPHRID